MSGPTISERLAILESGGVIDSPTRIAVESAIATIQTAVRQSLERETGHMLATHLAMALKRASLNEPLSALPDGLESELADHPEDVALARVVLTQAGQALGVVLPEAEALLVGFYIVTLRVEEHE